jgi:hypothetical protein
MATSTAPRLEHAHSPADPESQSAGAEAAADAVPFAEETFPARDTTALHTSIFRKILPGA